MLSCSVSSRRSSVHNSSPANRGAKRRSGRKILQIADPGNISPSLDSPDPALVHHPLISSLTLLHPPLFPSKTPAFPKREYALRKALRRGEGGGGGERGEIMGDGNVRVGISRAWVQARTECVTTTTGAIYLATPEGSFPSPDPPFLLPTNSSLPPFPPP